jgi:phage gp36-like protein
MALPDLFTTAELEIACGGAGNLVRLSKASSASASTYTTFVEQVKAIANGDVYSIVGNDFDITTATVQGAAILQQHAVTIGVFWAHSKGTGGMEIPQQVTEAYRISQEWLEKMARGLRGLGTETQPTGALAVQQVDMYDAGRGWTRGTWGGFS